MKSSLNMIIVATALLLANNAIAQQATTTEENGESYPAATKTNDAQPNSFLGTDAQGRLTFKKFSSECAIGSIKHFEQTSNDPQNPSAFITDNYRIANGETIYAVDYPEYVAKKTGDSDATEVSLPDYRAHFLRGADLNRGIDIERTIGQVQGDEIKEHDHRLLSSKYFDAYYIRSDNADAFVQGFQKSHGGTMFTNASSITKSGGNETRPKNYAVVIAVCVK
ncbi:hypothetical protein [Thalassomonas actiniarum]|uniref:Phage tail collar domain-containing protein n=1 Tax=Thalassomonas actiniarum TaxID=485447 RepID=A0AAE9YXK9_9GAMM|nr:hypothetical protein [Thalassomonas actiniarum]WDE02285.1 hypothetical protein SG35_031525 [Thalassomonas actiniarum]